MVDAYEFLLEQFPGFKDDCLRQRLADNWVDRDALLSLTETEMTELGLPLGVKKRWKVLRLTQAQVGCVQGREEGAGGTGVQTTHLGNANNIENGPGAVNIGMLNINNHGVCQIHTNTTQILNYCSKVLKTCIKLTETSIVDK